MVSVILRQLLAVSLVLVMANPVCCCTVGTILGAAPESEAPLPLRCCCCENGSTSDQQSPDVPEEAPDCPCAAESSFLVEAKAPQLDRVRAEHFILVSEKAAGVAMSPRLLCRDVTKAPSPPPPGYSWRRYCCYLL